MRGEHELDLLGAGRLVHARRVDARGDHPCNGVAVGIKSRFDGVPSSGPHLGGSPLAHLVSLLCGVRQREKEREGSNDLPHILGRERRDDGIKLREGRFPIVGLRFAQHLALLADALDRLVHVRPRLLS